MRGAAIIGVGTTPVTAGTGRSLTELFVDAAIQAINDAGVDKIDSIYVGNMMSGFLQNQEHLGALMATAPGGGGWPPTRVEGAWASGGAARNAAVKGWFSGWRISCWWG